MFRKLSIGEAVNEVPTSIEVKIDEYMQRQDFTLCLTKSQAIAFARELCAEKNAEIQRLTKLHEGALAMRKVEMLRLSAHQLKDHEAYQAAWKMKVEAEAAYLAAGGTL